MQAEDVDLADEAWFNKRFKQHCIWGKILCRVMGWNAPYLANKLKKKLIWLFTEHIINVFLWFMNIFVMLQKSTL